MRAAIHVIMTVHPILILLPILGFRVLPFASAHLENSLRIVANLTVENPGECDVKLCHPHESCTKALLHEGKCFLFSCLPIAQNSSCENITIIQELLTNQEFVYVDSNQPSLNGSFTNTTEQSTPTANVSASSTSASTNPPSIQNQSTTIVIIKLQTTPSDQAFTEPAVSPAFAIPATIPTRTATTTTNTTKTSTTTKPPTTTTKPSTTTSNITTTPTVAQTPKHLSLPSPSGTKTSSSVSPLVPTIPPSTTSTKLPQLPPIPTSSEDKPLPTTLTTSTSPTIVASTLPKDIPKGDQDRTDKAIVEVAGDPLSSHLFNTSSLLAVLLFGLLLFVVMVTLFLKQAYESYRRKDYTQVDYLINGMYSDSGV
ncbi:uncharacterized protein C11orf24 homolog isoform X1 [Myxocyprinus asiaticus]|uniref:uncharacterized protein C11orf24 homolog isoform X1 n=1 Tax=Myxocyprinus asiaticus TaxID=70543 RepID=UPI0022218E60|nr:uncharacterized protein C11orf24 homolog isoform X1 [Myxocyprinus asiaticus]